MRITPDIPSPDEQARQAAASRLDRLTKPAGSLGRLEEIGVWLAGIQSRERPRLTTKTIFVVAADHGVARHGVSAYPQAVTGQMVANFLNGGAAINVLSRQAGAKVVVVDAGIIEDPGPKMGLVSRRLGYGTADLATSPAMSEQQAVDCIETGIALAAAEEADIIGCGDMGIGNTTAASAITSALLRCPPAEVTGRGTGIDEAARAQKVALIEKALALHRPDVARPLEVLQKVGGFEIGVLAGIFIGGAARRRALLVDGFISTSAALLADAIAPGCRAFMLASHLSTEPGHRRALAHLGLVPLLDLGLRLGEGTGAALAIPIVEAACRIISEMATFDDAGVSERGSGK